MRNGIVFSVLPLLLAGSAYAVGVRIIRPTGAQNFSDIQAAVDSAVDGDVLLVGAGTYTGFTINAKAVSILAAPAGAAVVVRGKVKIASTTWHPVILSGLTVQHQAPLGISDTALELFSDTGPVRIQDSSFQGSSGDPYQGGYANAGAELLWCTQVVFERCKFFGATGYFNYLQGGQGASSVYVNSSLATFHDCEFRGGAGGNSEDEGGDGGAGLYAESSLVFAAGSSFRGGNGGNGDPNWLNIGGDGGPGMELESGATADLLDNTYAGGLGGSFGGLSGPPTSGVGFNYLSGTARKLAAPVLVTDRTLIPLTVQGAPGDRVWARVGVSADYTPKPLLNGISLVLLPSFLTLRPVGVIPPSGQLVVQLPTGDLPSVLQDRRLYAQGLVYSSQNQGFLTGLNCVFVLNRDAGPDCNGNGVMDYVDVAVAPTVPDCNTNLSPDGCDIASGTSPDVNGNGIPDECE